MFSVLANIPVGKPGQLIIPLWGRHVPLVDRTFWPCPCGTIIPGFLILSYSPLVQAPDISPEGQHWFQCGHYNGLLGVFVGSFLRPVSLNHSGTSEIYHFPPLFGAMFGILLWFAAPSSWQRFAQRWASRCGPRSRFRFLDRALQLLAMSFAYPTLTWQIWKINALTISLG